MWDVDTLSGTGERGLSCLPVLVQAVSPRRAPGPNGVQVHLTPWPAVSHRRAADARRQGDYP